MDIIIERNQSTCSSCGKRRRKKYVLCSECRIKQGLSKRPYQRKYYTGNDNKHYCQNADCKDRFTRHYKKNMFKVKKGLLDIMICKRCGKELKTKAISQEWVLQEFAKNKKNVKVRKEKS